MRALITGGAGFIGSHLADYLIDTGHQVVVVDDLSTGSMTNIAHLLDSPNFRFKQGSILDSGILESAFTESFSATAASSTLAPTPTPSTPTSASGHDRVDTVFHLASLVGVQLVVSKPLEVLRNAIDGITLVMEAATRHGCRVLVASSSEIYGKNTSVNISEGDDRVLGSPLKSRWSYSEGKAIEELFAYTYWHEKGTPTVIARLFNTVGPRQSGSYGMVLPRFVRQAVQGEPLTIYGDGSQRRCFCYVGDVVPALVELVRAPVGLGDGVSAAGAGEREMAGAEAPAGGKSRLGEQGGGDRAYGRAFNVGSRAEITIEALARKVIALTGSSSTLQNIPYEDMPDGFEDMPRRVPDITSIQELTSFNPSTPLDDIIMMLAGAEGDGSAGR